MDSLATLLPLLDPGMLAPFAAEGAVSGIAGLMERLPLASGGGFECRLGGAGPVDISIHVPTGSPEMLALADLGGENGSGDASFPGDGIAALARRLADPDDPLRSAIDALWLELDGGRSDEPSLIPDCFFGLTGETAAPPLAGEEASARRRAASATIREALGALGAAVPAESIALIDRILDRRPAGSSIAFIGAMTGRGAAGGAAPELRVVLRRMPVDELTAFLAALGWGWDHLPLVPLLALLRRHRANLALQLTLAPAVGPKLGFELSFPDDDDKRWRRLLADLQEIGLAQPAGIEAAMAWPRRFHRDVSPEWPAGIDERWNHLFRRINHLKLTYDAAAMPAARRTPVPPIEALVAHQTLSAKIYLAYAIDRRFPSPTLW